MLLKERLADVIAASPTTLEAIREHVSSMSPLEQLYSITFRNSSSGNCSLYQSIDSLNVFKNLYLALPEESRYNCLLSKQYEFIISPDRGGVFDSCDTTIHHIAFSKQLEVLKFLLSTMPVAQRAPILFASDQINLNCAPWIYFYKIKILMQKFL